MKYINIYCAGEFIFIYGRDGIIQVWKYKYMLHVKKNIKNYDDLHKKGCTNKFYVLLYMQTVDMHFFKRFT